MEEPLAETAVFVDTNLGTRFAFSVPSNITACDLKRKLKYEHSICFPNVGKIIVHSLMVKKKSTVYHIPNSMLIKEAFQGFRSTWFLQIDASKLADVSTEPDTTPSSNREEINNSDFNQVPASRNLLSPSNSACCKLEVSTSNCCSTSEMVDFTFSSIMNADERIQAGEIAGDCSSREKGKGGVLSSSMKRRKLAQNNQRNATSKMAAVAREIYKSVPGLEVIEGDILMDETQYTNQENIGRLSAHSQGGGQSKNCFSKEEDPSANLSEKISVSGLILRYFSDSDEGNSKGLLHRNTRQTETMQMNNILNIQKSLPTDETGCAAKDDCYLADHGGAYETRSDSDTACSFNMTPSEANQVCPMSKKNTKNNKDKPIASCDKRRPKPTGSTVKSHNTLAKFSAFQAGNQISSARSNRKLALSPPHPISRFSPQTPPFRKSSKILSSSINKCEVGNRLVQAAKKICSSFSVKKSAMSLNSRCRNMSAADSIIIAKRLCFEMDDSDG